MSTIKRKAWAIVPAAGSGSRMGQDMPKQYLQLRNQSVIEHTLARLLSIPQIEAIVVPLSAGDAHFQQLAIAHDPRIVCTEGGRERSDSVLAGLDYLASHFHIDDNDWVLVHDAARCCIRPQAVENLLATVDGNAQDRCGAILAVPAVDTLKQVRHQQISQTLDRSQIWQAQTPQVFPFTHLNEALIQAQQQGLAITDEASALELQGKAVEVVMGHYDNIKITHPQDLTIAEMILTQQQAEQ